MEMYRLYVRVSLFPPKGTGATPSQEMEFGGSLPVLEDMIYGCGSAMTEMLRQVIDEVKGPENVEAEDAPVS